MTAPKKILIAEDDGENRALDGYDQLTGLCSEESFYEQAEELLGRNPDKSYDIICSEIENFSQINDCLGTDAGKCLLCGVADWYRTLSGSAGLCGRLRADRFACLLERRAEYRDETFAQAIAEINGRSGTRAVVMRWGIYPVTDRSMEVERMCGWALLAARSVRGRYGRHFALCDENLQTLLCRQQAMVRSMGTALEERQFVIYLQPKYRIKDYQLSGAEVLIRWQHPELGFLLPDEFIPLFEQSGFITRLDQFVWDSACALLQKWDEKGLPPIAISVNVSRADIYQRDIAKILEEIVNKYGITPSRLHLEITESAYAEDQDQIISEVGRLRRMGFAIEMDDFGSGYSSLNMLLHMPIDTLKMDMKFIQSETEKTADQSILRFIMGLARTMNLSVIAEGVETKAQLDRLQELGCDFVQGYYLARPMDSRAFEELLREQGAGAQESSGPQDHSACDSKRQARFILLAVEDADYRSRLRAVFEPRFQVAEVDGAEAALLFIAGRYSQMAAAVVSLTLPGPDGYAVLEALRLERSFGNVPVVALAQWDEQSEKRAMEMGADDFAEKDHSPESVFRRVIHAMRTSALIERERTLQQRACQDPLTGLSNRWGLTWAVDDLRGEDGPLAVYLFSLDNLGELNETLGRDSGDRLIRQFSVTLRTHTRSSDVLARYGGDEFVVIMRHMRSEEHALKKGREICQAIGAARLENGFIPVCTAGVVICDPTDSMTEMITWAGRALRRGKQERRGTCRLGERTAE